jgi:hypothetical protein
MDPIATSPQPIHEMVPVLFVLSFVLLFGFLLGAKLVNWIARRPLLNGGSAFFWLLLTFVVGFAVYSSLDERITLRGHRIIGQATAALVPSLAVGFFLGRRFKKKARATALSESAD